MASGTATRAALVAARGALVAAGGFGQRVRRDLAEPELAEPFCIMTAIDAAVRYSSKKNTVEVVTLRVLAVGATQAEADEGALSIDGALQNKGVTQGGALDASALGWDVLSCRKIIGQSPAVELDEGREIYRAGADFEMILEMRD